MRTAAGVGPFDGLVLPAPPQLAAAVTATIVTHCRTTRRVSDWVIEHSRNTPFRLRCALACAFPRGGGCLTAKGRTRAGPRLLSCRGEGQSVTLRAEPAGQERVGAA